MLRRLWMVAATLVLALAQAQVQRPDPAKFGFPTVTASLIVQPWDSFVCYLTPTPGM